MKKLNLLMKELPSNIEESLDRLRVNIIMTESDVHSIHITSSLDREGKEYIGLNLWRIFAETGYKVCYLDLDYRNEREKLYEAQESDMGVESYLTGDGELEAVIYESNYDNGHLIPLIKKELFSKKLIESERCEELIKKLTEDYRYVIVNSAPINDSASSAVISSYCDGTVLVVKEKNTSKKLVGKAISDLSFKDSNLIGAVLVKTEK